MEIDVQYPELVEHEAGGQAQDDEKSTFWEDTRQAGDSVEDWKGMEVEGGRSRTDLSGR